MFRFSTCPSSPSPPPPAPSLFLWTHFRPSPASLHLSPRPIPLAWRESIISDRQQSCLPRTFRLRWIFIFLSLAPFVRVIPDMAPITFITISMNRLKFQSRNYCCRTTKLGLVYSCTAVDALYMDSISDSVLFGSASKDHDRYESIEGRGRRWRIQVWNFEFNNYFTIGKIFS